MCGISAFEELVQRPGREDPLGPYSEPLPGRSEDLLPPRLGHFSEPRPELAKQHGSLALVEPRAPPLIERCLSLAGLDGLDFRIALALQRADDLALGRRAVEQRADGDRTDQARILDGRVRRERHEPPLSGRPLGDLVTLDEDDED